MKKVICTCTDERPILRETLQPGDEDLVCIRLPGGGAGLIHAIEDADAEFKVGISREEIIKEAQKAGLVLYNHRDNHNRPEDDMSGCGYLALVNMSQSGGVFGRDKGKAGGPEKDTAQAMRASLDIPILTLDGTHVAQDGGLLINLNVDQALNPEGPAQNSFFSLDLGIVAERLALMGKELGMTGEMQRRILINLVRDNMAACYVLSGGAINEEKFIVVGGGEKPTPEMRDTVETAYEELVEPERIKAMDEMIKARQSAH